MKIKILLIFSLFVSKLTYSQSDFEKILKGGELIVNGLSFLKKDKTETKETNAKIIESVCIKNKLANKITYSMIGKDEEGNVIKKEPRWFGYVPTTDSADF